MSHKYLVFAEVDGEIRILSLLFNGSEEEVGPLSRQLAEKLFAGRRVLAVRAKSLPFAPFESLRSAGDSRFGGHWQG